MYCSYLTTAFAPTSKFNIASLVTQTQSEHIPCVSVCIVIDTMLNFDGDINANVKCEQAFADHNLIPPINQAKFDGIQSVIQSVIIFDKSFAITH